MIFLKNSQRKIKIDKKQVGADIKAMLEALGYADFAITIWITTDNTIARYNKRFRGKDKPTDILSFPFHPEIQPGKRIRVTTQDEKNLGDIIISAEYVQRDLARWGVDFTTQMRALLAHGICHLIGYDHESDADYRIMRKKELFLLKQLTK